MHWVNLVVYDDERGGRAVKAAGTQHGLRAGVLALLVLSDSLNLAALRQLGGGPLTAAELLGTLRASRATRFKRLRTLEELGLIVREKHSGWPPPTYCRLSDAGHSLLAVAEHFEAWLACRQRRVGSGELERSRTIKALASGLGSTLVRWLAERPRSTTELEALTPREISHHDIKRALHALSDVGLAEPLPRRKGRRHPYALTAKGREAAAPIAAALHWERDLHADPDPAWEGLAAETLLYLAAPLALVPVEFEGTCAMSIDEHDAVSITVSGGRLLARALAPGEAVEAEVRGSGSSWLTMLVSGRPGELELTGDANLIAVLTLSLHQAIC
jgi:DNA-binding HxlR family transcriptional regulator